MTECRSLEPLPMMPSIRVTTPSNNLLRGLISRFKVWTNGKKKRTGNQTEKGRESLELVLKMSFKI